jgi:hypothetical protein
MTALFRMKVITPLLSVLLDLKVYLSAALVGFSMASIDLGIKVLFGLPGAIYICFKIYHEFLKKKKNEESK